MSLIRMACGNCWCGLVPVIGREVVGYKLRFRQVQSPYGPGWLPKFVPVMGDVIGRGYTFCPVCKGNCVVMRRIDDEGMDSEILLASVHDSTRNSRVPVHKSNRRRRR